MRKENRLQMIEERSNRRIPTTRYRPEYRKGLTNQQVQEHRLHGWSNISVDPPAKTTKEIIHDNLFTYFNLIFLILAILLCIAGSFRNLTFKYIDWNCAGNPGKKGSGQADHAQCAACNSG